MAEKDEDQGATIAETHVLTKYKLVADIVNDIMKKVIGKCVAGVTVLEVCEFGDNLISEGTNKIYKKDKEMKKGIAFPTCISINNCVCHFSPLRSEPDIVMKDGDLIKIDLGAHLDGFPAVVAHTIVVGASKDNKVTGRKADVILAAQTAAEIALRLVKPGNENSAVTDAIQKAVESFKCKPVEGMLSHQLKQHIIDGEKAIIQNPTDNQRKDHEKCEFEVNEVYGIDILVTSGEGKGREMEARTTVYKKKDIIYNLKMKASRQFFSEVDKKYSAMPFTLRSFEDERKAKMGVVECVKHELIEPFPVLWEREGEFVAQYKFTLLLTPTRPMRITGLLPVDPDVYQSEYSVQDEELKALLATSISKKGTKNRKKKAVAAVAAAVAEVVADTGKDAPAAPATATAAES